MLLARVLRPLRSLTLSLAVGLPRALFRRHAAPGAALVELLLRLALALEVLHRERHRGERVAPAMVRRHRGVAVEFHQRRRRLRSLGIGIGIGGCRLALALRAGRDDGCLDFCESWHACGCRRAARRL